MKKFLKALLGVIVIGGLTAAAIYFTTAADQSQRGRRWARADGPVPVIAAPARLADVPVWLEGVGSARARNTVTVRPQVDGKILSINFTEGQEVNAGDLLAQIDPVTYQAQLDQAVAKKVLDESQLANAKKDLERYTKLSANVIAAKTVDTQRALVAQLEAQIKADQAAIDNAKAYLDYTRVTAPISGRTGMRLIDVGNLVRASDGGIVVITEVQPISVVFTLPQQELPAIHRSFAKGPLQVEALETDSKSVLDTGRLQVIDNQVEQSTGTIRLKADFPNKDLQLWPGQFVNARMLVDTLQQVVVVPTSAVQRGPSGSFVYVIGDDNRVQVRNVAVRKQDERIAVLSSGVTPAETVVTTGFARLKDGAEVSVSAPESRDGGDPSAAIPTGSVQRAAIAGEDGDATAAPGTAAEKGERRRGKKREHRNGERRKEAGKPNGRTP